MPAIGPASLQWKPATPGHISLRLVAQLGFAALQDALQVEQVLRLPNHLHRNASHCITSKTRQAEAASNDP